MGVSNLIRARRPSTPARETLQVEAWGPEPIGANQVEALLARRGADLAGFTAPNPAGWGLNGSVETTDTTVWASPQSFTGAQPGAMAALSTGAVAPTVYPQDAAMTGIVLPGPGGV